MEQEQIIPTRYKAKIPHTLSYPVGAKVISEALSGVPQFAELTVTFRFWNQLARHHGTATPYRVVEAEYHGPRRSFSSSNRMIDEGFYSPKWTISVDAVPRSLRHVLQGKIVAEVLPNVRRWLLANPHSNEREGSHRLTFTFDELLSELTCEEQASVEFQTAKVDRP